MRRIVSILVVALLFLAACNVGTTDGVNETAVPPVEEPVEEEPLEEPEEEPTATPEVEEPTATPEEEATPEGEAPDDGAVDGEAPEDGVAPGEFAPVVALEQIVEGLTAPVAMAAPDDGTDRLFIVDQVGLIYVADADGTLVEEPFLDLSDRIVELNEGYDERGLLGLAFHPDYADNGRFFVYYSAPLQSGAPEGWNHTSHLSEFTVSEDDPNLADADSENVILRVDQPQGNHNSGAIAFGPDGYLYVPLGDGGGADDVGTGHVEDWYEENEGGNGQDISDNLLGSILRLDVDGEEPYGIPDDNPFVEDEETLDEIWAYGFRNPYRMAFDPGGDNELFVGDAGQELWEEVSIVEGGGNYGWNVKEGTHCFNTDDPEMPLDTCPDEDPAGNPLIDPIIEFANSKQPDGEGLVVIGGTVYRGSALPAWDGRYIFGQWSSSFDGPTGGLFVATRPEEDDMGLWDYEAIEIEGREGGQLREYLLAFGQDLAGEVYVLTSESAGPSGETGKVYRIAAPEGTEMMEEDDLTPTPEDGEAAAGGEAEVVLENTSYVPRELTVDAGTTVTWTNNDSFPHTVTSGVRGTPTDLFGGALSSGESFSFTFDEPGTYDYFCEFHTGMEGVVIVE